MARRGLRSLGIAIAVPLGLTVVTINLFGSGHKYQGIAKPFWFPPLWVFHLSSLSTSCLMSLSAWLVWAEGGFHQQSAALPLFLAQFLLSQMWTPIVFRSGAKGVGLAVCLSLFMALYGCSKTFKRVNPIAGDLVKPCLAWAGFLGLMNFKLL
ncbi:translocator protein homolog [Aristolochia californica]|uniref:translocator protein homolog n=1 Tax=Aristolochia californica TaxID=171875 RepID=UPI0035E22379